MPDDEPRLYSGTIPAVAGCLAALPVLFLLLGLVLFVSAWGAAHCGSRPACVRRSNLITLVELAVAAGIVLLFGLSVGTIVRRHMQRRWTPAWRDRRPGPLMPGRG
ncbi:MAG TPA: hypothetical protein VF535_11905 [Allosphingosinicella sp.]|jgi:hypothetical protein